MKKNSITRRQFVKKSAVLAAALPLSPSLVSWTEGGIAENDLPALNWLEGKVPTLTAGATWGIPWPRGRHKVKTDFSLQTTQGNKIAVQTWPLAYWPDGTLKWTAHAIAADAGKAGRLQLVPGKNIMPEKAVQVSETPGTIRIDTGVIRCTVEKKGTVLISSIVRDGKNIAADGKLVMLCQDAPDGSLVHTETFSGEIGKVSIEQNGPVRATVKIEGKHVNNANKAWLPFVLRLYFYAGGESVRVMHTIIFDGDENKDFIKGLGLSFAVPMHNNALHNRHIRFAGENKGMFAEAVRGLTGLRRDPGRNATQAQVNGKAVEALPQNIQNLLQYIPAFGDYKLSQTTADSFQIRKRTKEGYTWINSASGRRSAGVAYAGTPAGGLAFGIRNFWQSHPGQLDIRNAATDKAEIIMWVWAPDAPAMDLRFYHDGMGQDTYAKQLQGLEITYEDYEPGFGTPKGVARTSEMMLWALPATPGHERLLDIAESIQVPPTLVCQPEYLFKMGVFGANWSLPDSTSPAKATIEKQLDWYFNFYHKEVESRRWYGFWDYGDVMHSYDTDRHVWKYDVGGFAWDNSELSTDLWLWYYFLRTGRADVFRMAEAMTRHTGEVDVHHLGPFAPLGSRHNVLHWGCSAKQLRISTAANRRFYYYLTGDERTGDLMREQVDADRTLNFIEPGRKLGRGTPRQPNPNPTSVNVSFGTDWGALAGAWLTEWERTGSQQIKNKLLTSMQTIAAQPKGFFSSGGRMELATGKFGITTNTRASASHLNSVFGLSEICAELVSLIKMPEFEKAWLQYCELYNAKPEEQRAALGNDLGSLNLRQSHAKLTAYAAKRKGDPKLAERAWHEFYNESGGITRNIFDTQPVNGPAYLNTIEEARGVSTNAVAQWGLAAMQCLAFAGEYIPAAP